jgi:hypothetical protein
MKKKKEKTLHYNEHLMIDPESLASTAVELMKLSPVSALSNEDFRPFVARAFSLLTLAHQYIEEQSAHESKKA